MAAWDSDLRTSVGLSELGRIDVPAPAAGYRIDPQGRYSHTEAYVRKTLAETGFEVSAIDEAFLRREGESYVAGLVVLARRAASGEARL